MIVNTVVQKGESLIGELSKDVTDVQSEATQSIITNLVDSMRHYNLVGMAAPQIGQSVRIFVVEVRETMYRKDLDIREELKVFINPKITWHSEEENSGYEGCGSVDSAGLFGLVERWDKITVEALDKNGVPFEYKAEGFLARVVQHEYDHLQGILFIDKVVDMKQIISKDEYMRKFRK